MHKFLDICRTGLAAVLLHPLRSTVSFLALVVVLLPYLVGLGVAKGLEAAAEGSVRFGADLHVTGSQFGRPVPIAPDRANEIGRLPGVTAVVPRIVGEVALGKERIRAVLVGIPLDQMTTWTSCIDGEPPGAHRPKPAGHRHRAGAPLALKIGSTLLPFYHNNQGERLSQIVGIFKPDAPPWQANLILTSLATAETVFDQPGLCTDLLVSCRAGYQDSISRKIEQDLSYSDGENRKLVRFKVTAREDVLAILPRGLLHREGIFDLHFLLAFVVAILVLLVTSGLGLAERRREIGILKATGWQTDEILLRGVVESCALSLAGACVALLLAWLWLRVLNGYGIAGLFLDGVGTAPAFTVPFRITPVPALFAFVLAFVVVLTGTVYSTWRSAIVLPREAIR